MPLYSSQNSEEESRLYIGSSWYKNLKSYMLLYIGSFNNKIQQSTSGADITQCMATECSTAR